MPKRLGGAKLIVNLTSPTDRPGRPREPGSDPVCSDRPTRSEPCGGGDAGPELADRPTRFGGRPCRRSGSNAGSTPLASKSQPPSSLRFTSVSGRQPLAWLASGVWVVPSVWCVQQATAVSTMIVSAVAAAIVRLMAARQRRRTSRSGASVHCKKCTAKSATLPPLEHVSTSARDRACSQATPHRRSSFSRQMIVVQFREVSCAPRRWWTASHSALVHFVELTAVCQEPTDRHSPLC